MTAKQLKGHRARLGLTIFQMAEAFCVYPGTYARWEYGKTKLPRSMEKLFCLMFDIQFKEKINKAYSESPDLF